MQVQRKRIAALLMAGAMLFSTLPVSALAVENPDTGGLCEHHPEHTAECGYTEGAEGAPCGHEHTEDCYALVENCVHSHTDECYPQESVSDNVATPPDADKAEPTECAHECSEENGCITEQLDCQHEHDSECGYTEAVPGTPCTFVCEECNAETDEQEDECICDAPCTGEAVNSDCPICGADDADLTACKGEAQPEQPQKITITEFDPLDEDVANQIISPEKKLNLPNTLGASGYVGTQDSGGPEHLTIEGVTWEPDQPYDENAQQGAWLFTAVLPENYIRLDGVELPEISVLAEPVNLLADTVVVDYLDCDENGKNWTTKQATATLLDSYATSWSADDGTEHWYVVRGSINIDGRPTVTGDVHLILEDGSSLTARGITVQDSDNDPDNGSPNKLTIYAQSTGGNTGRLTATATGNNRSSGIGGGIGGSCGELTINGGIIEARGNSNNFGAGAGIGGGMSSGNAGNGGNITINGGKVTATSSRSAAGIGGSCNGMGGNITINGGEVTATGGSSFGGGSGIGGGYTGAGGTITISGGTVTASGGDGCAGIGDGNSGSAGTFSTGSNGNAVIFANSISDQSGKNDGNWKGVLFEGDNGQVYGEVTRTEDFEIPEGKTLSIPNGSELYLTEGATMTNRGTITVGGNSGNGLLDYTDGVINNYKDISGSTITPADESWNNKESEIKFVETSGETEYGSTYSIQVEVKEAATNNLLRTIPKKTVYLYYGDTLVGSAEVDDATKQASISITVKDGIWKTGKYELRASYTGSNDQLLPSETTSNFTLTVNPGQITEGMVEWPQPKQFTYDGKDHKSDVSVDGLTPGTDYTISCTRDEQTGDNFKDAGEVAVTVQGTNNYTGTVKETFTINQADLTITNVTLDEKIYNGDKTGTVESVTFGGLQNGERLTLGTDYNAEAEFDNPNVGTGKTATVTITLNDTTVAKNYTVTNTPFNLTGQTINKGPAPAAPTVTGDYAVSLTNPNKFVYTVTKIESAEYSKDNFAWQDSNEFDEIEPNSRITFYARIKETDNVNAGVAGNTGEVTFNKLANSKIPSLDFTVTGENGNRTITITSVTGAEYSFNDGAYDTSNVKTGCSGTVKVAIRYKETATLKASTPATQEVSTDKQEQTDFAISPVGPKTYGDAAFTLSATGGSGTGGVTFKSSDESILSISGTTATIKKAGNVTITAKKAEDNDYNEAEDTLLLSIDKRAITVTADSFTVVTGAALPTLTYQITSGSLAGTDRFTTDPTLFTTAKDTNTVKEYDIIISGGTLTNGDSYKITYEGGKLTVTDKTPVQLTLTANPATLSGGGAVTLTLTGLPAGGTATVSCSDSSITVSGSGTSWTATLPNRTAAYTFTANYSGDAQHTSAEAACTVSVTKRTSGGGSSSGGNDGGSTITDRPDKNDPDSPTTGQTKPVKPDKGGNVTIGGGDVQDAIDKATADAKKNSNQANGIAITVPVNNAADANSLTITIPAATLDKLVTAKVRRFDITTNGLPCFSFTLDTLKMLDSQSQGGDLILRLTKAAVTSAEAKAAIGTRPAYDITLVWVKNGKETPLTNWQGQTISVKLPYTPAKGEQAGNLYAVYVDGNGKVEWLTKSSYDPDQKAVLFEAAHFSVYGVGYKLPAPVFNDISGHWAEEHILFVASRGLLNGTGNNQFSPNTGMTRGMFVTALGRLAGINPASYQNGRFTDVKTDAYYAPYVNWAAQTGIVNGTTETTFSPDSRITREQMAVMMKNYADKLGYDLPATLEAVTFTDDANISAWAKSAVKAMQQAGILAGKDGNRFDPQGTATRAEVATVLHRFVEIVIDPQAANGWTENASGTRSYYKGGKPATGWLYDDKWYWLQNGGVPFAGGWKQIGGKWYFFNPDGTMAVNTTIDGYTIGPDGARK